MPLPHSYSIPDIDSFSSELREEMSDDMCLALLRKKEFIAYHHICGVFRAQGRLTPEKLKLLKEVAAALSIPECRHKAEVRIAVNSSELMRIAECVAGPDTSAEWTREGHDEEWLREPDRIVDSASLEFANAVAQAFYDTWDGDPTNLPKTLTIKARTMRSEEPKNNKKKEELNQSKKNPNMNINNEMPILKSEHEIKEEDKSGDLRCSVSTTSEPQSPVKIEKEEKPAEMEVEEKPDIDKALMPPPPVTITTPVSSNPPPCPVISVPPTIPASDVSLATSPTVITVPPSSSIPSLSPSPAIITVPPSSSILTLSPPHPAVITVPPSTSLSDISATSGPLTMSIPSPTLISASPALLTTPPLPAACEIDECTPVLSEDMQFVPFPESLDVSLPSLVVVPPPEPVITVPPSSSFSPSPSTPTLVLPTGMSIQLREENVDVKKRKRTVSQGGETSSVAPSPKTMAFSHISKMTPVMVSASGMKVTPTISRAKMAATTQSGLTSSTQKVIIVSNSASGSAPSIQRSINVAMNVPFLRATQPRIQPAPVSGALAKVRPKMLTVPAKCRPKSNPMMIPVSGHNLTLAIKPDNVTVVDPCGKKVPLGSGAPAKILPKPQTSMFVVNTSQGPQKITTPMSLHAAGPSTRMLSPRMVEGSGPKQNVVLLQKGGGKTQRVTLTNTSKDLVQKLMSKKCVVIQSSKGLPKNISPKVPPPAAPVSVHTSSASNVVVLDLSQEQYRQNLGSTTLGEILQASGILSASSAAPTVTSTAPLTTSVAAPDHSNNWLSLEASKNLALEEVTLPLGQTESIVTLDEAVELLGETVELPAPSVMEVESQSRMLDSSDQIFTITPEELAASSMEFMTERITADHDSNPNQASVDGEQGEPVSHSYTSHRDGAVTIQHSNIDMPANMSLEEYSSQQLENMN